MSPEFFEEAEARIKGQSNTEEWAAPCQVSQPEYVCDEVAVTGQTIVETNWTGLTTIKVASHFKSEMGNLANGGDFNPIMAFEGDSGTEYISSSIGEWTAWTHKPNGDSSAPCLIDEAFTCVWQFL